MTHPERFHDPGGKDLSLEDCPHRVGMGTCLRIQAADAAGQARSWWQLVSQITGLQETTRRPVGLGHAGDDGSLGRPSAPRQATQPTTNLTNLTHLSTIVSFSLIQDRRHITLPVARGEAQGLPGKTLECTSIEFA